MEVVHEPIAYANRVDRRKTVCTSYVLSSLGFKLNEYRYSGTIRQMIAIARRKWNVRRCTSYLRAKNRHLHEVNFKLFSEKNPDVVCYIVSVAGHVALTNRDGELVADSAPSVTRARVISNVYAVRY